MVRCSESWRVTEQLPRTTYDPCHTTAGSVPLRSPADSLSIEMVGSEYSATSIPWVCGVACNPKFHVFS